MVLITKCIELKFLMVLWFEPQLVSHFLCYIIMLTSIIR